MWPIVILLGFLAALGAAKLFEDNPTATLTDYGKYNLYVMAGFGLMMMFILIGLAFILKARGGGRA